MRRESAAQPEPVSLHGQLTEIARYGSTVEVLLRHPEITQLPLLRAALAGVGTEADRARRFEDVVRAGVVDLEDATQRAISIYFGIAPGSRMQGFPTRRRKAAQALGYRSVAHFRDHRRPGGSVEFNLVDTVLTILSTEPTDQPATPAHGQQRERRHPSESALELQWRFRFEHYARIANPLRGSAADIEAVIDIRHHAEPLDQYLPYVRSSIWRYAQFLRAFRQFQAELGGGWAFSTAQAEIDADEAVHACMLLVPFQSVDDSYLRVNLGKVEDEDEYPFLAWVDSDEKGRRILTTWHEWTESCNCRPDTPSATCRVHVFIKNAETFFMTVHQEWPRVADWYDTPAATWRLDPNEFHHQFPPRPPGSEHR